MYVTRLVRPDSVVGFGAAITEVARAIMMVEIVNCMLMVDKLFWRLDFLLMWLCRED
jgi:hypothetical protein